MTPMQKLEKKISKKKDEKFRKACEKMRDLMRSKFVNRNQDGNKRNHRDY